MTKYTFSAFVLVGLLFAAGVNAQVNDRMMASPPPSMMGATTTVECPTFSRGFGLGMRGADVTNIQNMLIEQKYLNAQATGYFGPLTRSAMMKFQNDKGISATGYFGQLSMAHANSICGKVHRAPGLVPPMKPSPCMMRPCTEGTTCPPCGTGTTTPPEKPMPCMMMPCLEGTTCPPCGGTTTPPIKPTPCPMIMCAEGTTCLPCGATTTPPTKPFPCSYRRCVEGATCPPCEGTTTPPVSPLVPTGDSCAMLARMCPDGGIMPRDNNCGWHPEQCPTAKPLPCMMRPCLLGTTCPPCGATTTPPLKPLPCPMVMCAAGTACMPCGGATSTRSMDMPTDPTPPPPPVF